MVIENDLIGNRIADKITGRASPKDVKVKIPVKNLHNNNGNDNETEDTDLTTNKKRYVLPKERQQIIDELRLVPI